MINYLGIALSGLFSIILGTIWYGPLFGKEWMRLSKIKKPKVITPKMKKEMTKSYSIQFICSLVMATVLSYLIKGNVTLTSSIVIAVLAWIGFVLTSMIGSVLWEGKSIKLYIINTAYFLVLLIGMTLILYFV